MGVASVELVHIMANATTTEGEPEVERQMRAWASQTPSTRIKAEITEVIFAGRLGEEQTGSSFGIVVKNPEVVIGSLYSNQVKPEDGLTADRVPEGESRPTDYRIVDEDDRNTTIANGALVTGEEGPNTYDPDATVEEEEVILWYNGLSGERLGRVLDFNGRPFARWTDDGYLIKGLFQVAEGWRGANSEQRKELKSDGKAPRVARLPILRDDVKDTEVLIDMTRYRGGRGYEIHVFDADAFEAEFGSIDHPTDEISRDQYYGLETESELDMPYSEDADDVIVEAFGPNVDEEDPSADFFMSMETGAGWQSKPEGAASGSGTGDFEVSVDQGSQEQTEEQYEQFAEMVASELAEGLTPDEAYNGGLESLIGKNAEAFHVVPSAGEIRKRIYARVSWLDEEDLDAEGRLDD